MRAGAKVAERGAVAYEGFAVLGVLVGAMWIVEVVNALDAQRLDGDGIIARQIGGLPGILSAPFIHASFAHLIANTIPFVILGGLIALAGAGRLVAVTVIVVLVSGLGAWALSASGTSIVGASGVDFGYAAFLIARGAFTRSVAQIAVGVLVIVVFGAALVWSLVPTAGISWQDHLAGAVGGVIAAAGVGRREPAS
jgi:membrane associated rhomboid family serine protease